MKPENEDSTPSPTAQKPSLVEWVAQCKKDLEMLQAQVEKRIYLENGGLLQ